MGQRFQVAVEYDGNLYLYHSQWLWGDFAIRRLGNFIKALKKKVGNNKYSFSGRMIRECLNWAFYKDLDDQNSIYPYFDNEVIDKKTLKEYEDESKDLKSFLNNLDNNDGVLIIKVTDKSVVGYAFYNIETNYDRECTTGVLMDYKHYMKYYSKEDEKWNKQQLKELLSARDLFGKLKVLEEFPEFEIFKK